MAMLGRISRRVKGVESPEGYAGRYPRERAGEQDDETSFPFLGSLANKRLVHDREHSGKAKVVRGMPIVKLVLNP